MIYALDGSMWTYVTEHGVGGPWLSPGVVQGPPGERGPEGPPGPQGPPGALPALDPWHDMRPLSNQFAATGGAEFPPQYRLSMDRCFVEVMGGVTLPPGAAAYNNTDLFTFPAAYRPPRVAGWPVAAHGGSPSQSSPASGGFPRAVVAQAGGLSLQGMQGGINGTTLRITGRFAVDNPDAPLVLAAMDEIAQPMRADERTDRR